ncbi:hypothetical protein ES703_94152 [subsurface metagenome]
MPLGSIVSNVTVTPVAAAGRGNCLYTYSIQSLIDSSDIAGTPFAKRNVRRRSFVPGDTSITVPFISTLLPCTETSGDAVAVVTLGPLPMAYMRWSYVSIVTITLSPMIPVDPQWV